MHQDLALLIDRFKAADSSSTAAALRKGEALIRILEQNLWQADFPTQLALYQHLKLSHASANEYLTAYRFFEAEKAVLDPAIRFSLLRRLPGLAKDWPDYWQLIKTTGLPIEGRTLQLATLTVAEVTWLRRKLTNQPDVSTQQARLLNQTRSLISRLEAAGMDRAMLRRELFGDTVDVPVTPLPRDAVWSAFDPPVLESAVADSAEPVIESAMADSVIKPDVLSPVTDQPMTGDFLPEDYPTSPADQVIQTPKGPIIRAGFPTGLLWQLERIGFGYEGDLREADKLIQTYGMDRVAAVTAWTLAEKVNDVLIKDKPIGNVPSMIRFRLAKKMNPTAPYTDWQKLGTPDEFTSEQEIVDMARIAELTLANQGSPSAKQLRALALYRNRERLLT